MTRIFAPLAIVAVLLVVGVLGLGLSLRAQEIRNKDDQTAQSWATGHRLAGLGGAIIVVLLHSIAATYFIGTSRWCDEVVEAYSLDQSIRRRNKSIKRRAFFLAFIGMLTSVGIGASGMAGDPQIGLRAQAPLSLTWTQVHLGSAACFLAYTTWSFWRIWLYMAANQQVIGEILGHVKRIRGNFEE